MHTALKWNKKGVNLKSCETLHSSSIRGVVISTWGILRGRRRGWKLWKIAKDNNYTQLTPFHTVAIKSISELWKNKAGSVVVNCKMN